MSVNRSVGIVCIVDILYNDIYVYGKDQISRLVA